MTDTEGRQGLSRGVLAWLVAISVVAAAGLVLGIVAVLQTPASEVAPQADDYTTPTIVTAEQLTAFGAANGPIYWAGPRDGTTYELTETPAGDVYIRYLPDGTEAGDERDDFLTVATYMVDGGYELLAARGEQDGQTATVSQSGAIVVTDDADDARAYFAFPGSGFQVEVFDPDPGVAEELVADGSLVLVR